eukprot:scaffold19168_cov107-Isochrysis_galbana.AAC.5
MGVVVSALGVGDSKIFGKDHDLNATMQRINCSEVQLNLRRAKRVRVVDSRSCCSKGGCCDSRRSLCCTHFPCQERQALAIGPRKCQQC